MLIYKCDGCSHEIDPDVEMLTISCNDGSLSIVKTEMGKENTYMKGFKALHFCGPTCLTNIFFKPKK